MRSGEPVHQHQAEQPKARQRQDQPSPSATQRCGRSATRFRETPGKHHEEGHVVAVDHLACDRIDLGVGQTANSSVPGHHNADANEPHIVVPSRPLAGPDGGAAHRRAQVSDQSRSRRALVQIGHGQR